MQQLDDDMDELFREAATHYPLKTEGQNWNAVMGRLQSAAPVAPAGNTSRNNGSRFFWLLLLTPLFFIAHLPEWNKGTNQPSKTNETIVTQEQNRAVPQKRKSNQSASGEPHLIQQSAAFSKADAINRNQDHTSGEVVLSRAVQNTGSTNLPLGAEDSSTANSTGNTASLLTLIEKEQTNDAAIADNTATEKLDTDSSAPPVIKKNKRSAEKGWYAGIVISPDLSTVKWQQTGKLGYGAGVLVGYRLSKRVAIETGLLWERKYYYSKGEYFDTKKIPGATNWNIIDVDGWCRMFEIPLQVRYSFGIRQNSNWYLNGGLSSYIMNRESYDYSYQRNNNLVVANRAYDNETRNWFSIIHAGIGYERTLGALGQLRIEPYLKMPVGGVGFGSLPVTSMGLNIGLTRSLR